ncbi:hypothetical protein [Chitinophaga nivalis]|uniref:Type II CBASS E2 protein domain-containing protein n=1 Tax=Chitinophaga nivalis TaxID=2991709 RepID=A0ABT3IQS6_9BACT|nr:hypothetical protein [Chitinophaga nivalis]MCW3486069.1 hypothetical protein [Chitinophaga nivalis]
MKSRISLIHQAGSLRSYFPESTITRSGETSLTWIGNLRPTALSNIYQVKLKYTVWEPPKVYVLAPKLQLAPNCIRLPHVYSTTEQQLCLYYPEYREWHQGMYYVKTLIPWASDWLYYYELWLPNGEWFGGGINHHGDIPPIQYE